VPRLTPLRGDPQGCRLVAVETNGQNWYAYQGKDPAAGQVLRLLQMPPLAPAPGR
jgi:hypothetical protein